MQGVDLRGFAGAYSTIMNKAAAVMVQIALSLEFAHAKSHEMPWPARAVALDFDPVHAGISIL
jgi:hypothetical protein